MVRTDSKLERRCVSRYMLRRTSASRVSEVWTSSREASRPSPRTQSSKRQAGLPPRVHGSETRDAERRGRSAAWLVANSPNRGQGMGRPACRLDDREQVEGLVAPREDSSTLRRIRRQPREPSTHPKFFPRKQRSISLENRVELAEDPALRSTSEPAFSERGQVLEPPLSDARPSFSA